jgi:AraC-like DNA-binding protein
MSQLEGSKARQRKSSGGSVTIGKLNSIVKASFGGTDSEDKKGKDSRILFEGNLGFSNLGLNLQVHVTDALAVDDVISTAIIEPSFSVLLLLEGKIDASLGKLPLNFSANDKPCGQLWSQTEPALFRRNVTKGSRVRKVNISLPIAWLSKLSEMDASLENNHFNSFVSTHLAIQEWTPSTSSIRCAEDIIAANDDKTTLNQIAISMWAFQILFDALSQINDEAVGLSSNKISERDLNRTRAVRNYINTHIEDELHLEDIAKEMNMSIATLQRLYKQCFGTTVIQYVRSKKLQLARQALIYDGASINQAAYIAGYSNASNFSTAFQREFGYPPSHCLNSSRHI